MSDISDMDPPVRAIVEHKPRQPGFWLKNLTGLEAVRYRAWRAGIMRELDEAREHFIRSESREAQLVDELLAGSRSKPVESPVVVELVTVPAAKESP